MKNWILLLLAIPTLLISCKKDSSSGGSSNTFEATLNGTKMSFTVQTSHLLRSVPTSEKRLDFSGISSDGNTMLIVTLGESTAVGNAMSVKSYTIRQFNEDNPGTVSDESEDSEDGFITLQKKVNGVWELLLSASNGTMVVSSCNESSKTISGTFEVTMKDLGTGAVTQTITAGKFSNLTYTVLN